jgi:toxin CcdB
MARFTVHSLPGSGLVVNLQSDFLDWLNTRLVAPLVPLAAAPPPAQHLNPVFAMEGDAFVMLTQSMAAVPVAALGGAVADLSVHQDEITRAVDMVFQGY